MSCSLLTALFLFLHFTLAPAVAVTPLAKALKKLAAAPSGEKLPYTHPPEENLIRAFAEETRLTKAEFPPALSKEEEKKRLFEIRNKKNQDLGAALTASANEGKPLSSQSVDEIYKELATNRVARVDAVTKYDTRGDVGFCFGRAMMVHYLLLQKGVPQDQIAKIFANKTIASLAILAASSSAFALIGPGPRPQVRNYCLNRGA